MKSELIDRIYSEHKLNRMLFRDYFYTWRLMYMRHRRIERKLAKGELERRILFDGWLCYCGHYEDSNGHCSECGNQPPWRCECDENGQLDEWISNWLDDAWLDDDDEWLSDEDYEDE